ncbi:MAG: 3-phosphoshikimate 1-carboxyvinyltransferase [Candidatus Hadarchaeales archaeon]
MASLTVRPSRLRGEISAPPSKSYTHRAFIIAALASGESTINGALISLDTKATMEAVEKVGARIEREGDSWRVLGTGGRIAPRSPVIDAMNSGTTMRIMSAVAALSPEPVRLTGDSSILQRPMGPLVDALAQLGANARCEGRDGRPPVAVWGGLKGGEVEITGSVSSQFLSALLISSPLAEDDVTIRVVGELRSRPYVEMTLSLLELAGIKIRHDKGLKRFKIEAGQVPKPIKFDIPGDFSSAAFPLGAAALTDSRITVKNLDMGMPQGDKRIVDFLREFGAEVKIGRRSVAIQGCETLNGMEAECGDNPDLVPILAVLGSVADGITLITNVSHLRFKETDRLRALAYGLGRFGARVEERRDGLRIEGIPKLVGTRVNSFGDHRMAMAFCVAGLRAEGKTVVEGVESIPVSYPGFVEDMRRLGARIEQGA